MAHDVCLGEKLRSVYFFRQLLTQVISSGNQNIFYLADWGLDGGGALCRRIPVRLDLIQVSQARRS